MGFLAKQRLIFTSKEYEDIYIKFNKSYDIPYQELFLICCTIGFKRNKKVKFKEKGREFRSNYWDDDSRVSAYCILLNDKDLNITIEDFNDKDRYLEFQKTLEEYAQGGMQILLDEVFPPNIINNINSKPYDEFIIDIMSYVYKESNAVPF